MDVPQVQVDWRSKGFWLPDGPRTAAGFRAERPSLFGGGFTWPILVLRQSAVEANIATMAGYCRRHGLDFAPHAKTTMAPGLIAAQFEAGAWGMTVATPNQALVLRRLGVPRVLLANEVLDPAALAWLARESEAGWEIYLQADSVAAVRAAAAVPAGTLRVLLEFGYAGGRTGVRTVKEVEAVAHAIAGAERLHLAGVTGYEGQIADQAGVDEFLDALVEGVGGLTASGLLPAAPMVSAGGSAWFDRVVARLAALRPEARVVLRSGASVTHDDGFYRERTPFLRVSDDGPLTAALELWAQVVSRPEPGLAIVGMGKRDAPYDEGLPTVLSVRGSAVDPATMQVMKLNDHHTYLSVSSEASRAPVVGDLVRFGISHPCTAFDKWRDIPVVDDDHRVVDVLHTYF